MNRGNVVWDCKNKDIVFLCKKDYIGFTKGKIYNPFSFLINLEEPNICYDFKIKDDENSVIKIKNFMIGSIFSVWNNKGELIDG